MFTIDLLKGKGIPTKRGPESIAVTAATFVVPFVVAIVMFSCYLQSKILTSIKKHEIVQYDAKITKLSDAIELQKSFMKEKDLVTSYLSQVASVTGRYTQWSPVLSTIAENMPSSMFLTNLDVRQKPVRVKVPKKNEPGKTVDVTVPERTLHMSICSRSHLNSDKAVREFRDRLRFSPSFENKLKNIKIAQEFTKIDGQDVISYELYCVFKPKF